jgi:hypothetical protein
MADAIDSLRHPRLERTVQVWRTLRGAVDPLNDTQILDLPDPPTKEDVAAYGLFLERPADSSVRGLVLNSGIHALAKALEANQGADVCRSAGASVSALLLSYDAAYLSARSFCLLLGFAPVNRESTVSVDVLTSYGDDNRDILEDNFAFFSFGRWGHSNIWALVSRLARTTKRTDDIEPNLQFLRRDKLGSVSNVRNQQIYGTSKLYNGDSSGDADFPDLVASDRALTMVVCRRYSDIFRNLVAIALKVVRESGLQTELASVASITRTSLAA